MHESNPVNIRECERSNDEINIFRLTAAEGVGESRQQQ